MARRRSRHRWPTCLRTGKRRLGERKDVKLELHAAKRNARLGGRDQHLDVLDRRARLQVRVLRRLAPDIAAGDW